MEQEKQRGITITQVNKCGLFCVILRLLKWIVNTKLFGGFAITTMVIGFTIVVIMFMALIGVFWTGNYSGFIDLFTNIGENWRKVIVIYTVTGLAFTLFIIE